MNTKLSATFAAVFCLMAASQAKATVNVAGNLLWSGDLPGLATDASVTPVVISTGGAWSGAWGGSGVWAFTNSGATFSGNAYPGWVDTGPDRGAISPAPGLAATTNWLRSWQGGPITMTTPKSESYLGFLMQSNSAFNVTLYNGAAPLGEITAAQIESAVAVNGAGWINVDVAGGGTYTSAVFSPTAGTDVDLVAEISYGTTSESLGAAPLPALAGTIPGFAAAILGMFGLRRRSRRV